MAPKTIDSISGLEDVDYDRYAAPLPNEIRLKDIFRMSNVYALKLLVHYELLQDSGGECPECLGSQLTLVLAKDRSDGYKWRCPKCKRAMSVRHGSIFAGSHLDIQTSFALLYMWVHDYDNRHAEWELSLDHKTISDWFGRFRRLCIDYQHSMGKIGGAGKIVEFDQTCLVHQKHHRGKPKPGTQVWYFVGVERDSGGRCFAVRINKRDIATIDKVIDNYIEAGSMLISDEWRAHLNIVGRLEEKGFQHHIIRHKKATGGGFARTVEINDEELRVHTNKCEGLNAHLKHKLKRLRGTSRRHVEGYLAEAVFRMNSRASNLTPFEAFVRMISSLNVPRDDDRDSGGADDDEDDEWSIDWSDDVEESESST